MVQLCTQEEEEMGMVNSQAIPITHNLDISYKHCLIVFPIFAFVFSQFFSEHSNLMILLKLNSNHVHLLLKASTDFHLSCLFQSPYHDFQASYDFPPTSFLDSFLSILSICSLHYSHSVILSTEYPQSSALNPLSLGCSQGSLLYCLQIHCRFQLIKQLLLNSVSKVPLSPSSRSVPFVLHSTYYIFIFVLSISLPRQNVFSYGRRNFVPWPLGRG